MLTAPQDAVSFPRMDHFMQFFIWGTLPAGCSSMEVFEQALKENVAVLPGMPFSVDGGGTDTMRLNFSNSTDEKIITGMGRLARVIRNMCSS